MRGNPSAHDFCLHQFGFDPWFFRTDGCAEAPAGGSARQVGAPRRPLWQHLPFHPLVAVLTSLAREKPVCHVAVLFNRIGAHAPCFGDFARKAVRLRGRGTLAKWGQYSFELHIYKMARCVATPAL